jgi:phospholipid/cholesterol/gamma-HCH transport system substrate-binding protein
MMKPRNARTGLAIVLALVLVAGIVVVARSTANIGRTHVVAYFDNSNGVFPGDPVFVLGVPVGAIDTIEPQPQRAKITFWFDDEYKVPADVKAVILSPQLITSRAIQLTPAYTSGPQLRAGAVIPQERTAVPMEWDDFREQLEKLSDSLQPTQPGGVSPLGAFINTTADNLRGQGANIRDTVIQLSQAFSALGDHSDDIFSTIKNLAILVSALHSSSDLMAQLNRNLASVTALLADDPNEIGRAVSDIRTAATEVKDFVAENREALGTTSEKLASVSQALVDSLDDVKQTLHVAPNAFQNFINIYEPAHASVTGLLALNNFANPISFLCGAIQAASRLGAEQSSKLCVQYLAPIVKNRQLNFPPIGLNVLNGANTRPNEVTYSEDWMRPDYRPTTEPPPRDVPLAAEAPPHNPPPGAPADAAPLPAEATVATDPAQGLPGIMVPPGGGS